MINDHKIKTLLKKIFLLRKENFEEPVSWVSWKQWEEGKSNYKPFSLQLRECSKDGTKVRDTCCWCKHEILTCKRYGGLCHSSKCINDRIKK